MYGGQLFKFLVIPFLIAKKNLTRHVIIFLMIYFLIWLDFT